MSFMPKLAGLVAAGALLVAGALPAAADTSATTAAFLANVHPNIDFLDRSSRMAMDHSSNPRIRSFAHREALEQTIVANSVVAWTQTNTAVDALGVVEPGVIAPGASVATVEVPDVETGRSVAVDLPVAPLAIRPVVTSRGLLPSSQDNLDRLSTRRGRAFDALYTTTQIDALDQLATLYRSYIDNGDDAELRGLSERELPKVRARLMQLRRM